jgi:hypothetical protein
MIIEWCAFGLDRLFMFLFAVSSGLAIVLTVMFSKSAIERGIKKYINMDLSLFLEV